VRIVLDACVPAGLAAFLGHHDVTTVSRMFGTSDIDDGELLDRLRGHCDAFVTVDKSIRFQQNLRSRPFPIALLRAHSNSLEHLVPLVSGLLVALEGAGPGDVLVIGV
jgi:predicted nuclease of predicted toxin-antitoxin system